MYREGILSPSIMIKKQPVKKTKTGFSTNEEVLTVLATRHELDGMYGQLKDILVRINYLNPENPEYWMNRVRQFFTRVHLRAREVSIIRGVCRQMDWYAQKRYTDGLKEKGKI